MTDQLPRFQPFVSPSTGRLLYVAADAGKYHVYEIVGFDAYECWKLKYLYEL